MIGWSISTYLRAVHPDRTKLLTPLVVSQQEEKLREWDIIPLHGHPP